MTEQQARVKVMQEAEIVCATLSSCVAIEYIDNEIKYDVSSGGVSTASVQPASCGTLLLRGTLMVLCPLCALQNLTFVSSNM